MFVFAGTEHEVFDGFAGIFAFVEDELHLFGDGHFDVVDAGQAEGGARGEDAFSNFAAEGGEDLREFAALAERLADGAVAAERAGAGEHQVASAGEAGEGFAAAAAGNGEAGDFGDAAGHESGGGVVAEADAGSDAGGDGDDIFECAAELDADDVGGGVEAQRLGGELLLDAGGDGGVVEGDGDGGGLALRDFNGEAGPGECADGEGIALRERGAAGMPEELTSGAPVSTKTSRWVSRFGLAGSEFRFGNSSKTGGDDLGHAQEGVVFHSLGGGDDDLAVVHVGAQAGEGGAQEF